MFRFHRLTWLQRITLILFVTVVTNWVMVWTTGYSLIGGDLFVVFFIGFLILFILTLVRPLMTKVVWRVRNRLLVTYFFVGVLPIALMIIFVMIGFYLVLGQIANYLLNTELNARLTEMYNAAERIASDTAAGRERSGSLATGETVVIRTGSRPAANFPSWSVPGFKGIVRDDAGAHFLAVHAKAGSGAREVEVFASNSLTEQALSHLLPGLASVSILAGEDLEIRIGKWDNPTVRQLMNSESVAPVPPARGFWDLDLESPTPLAVRLLDDGREEKEVIVLKSRPSLVLTKLFSTLGNIATVLAFVLLVIAVTFVVVEVIAIIFSAQLTRTLTRSVHQLYLGTKKVESGDFSHRIPIRNQDQLSELAGSFNSMTRRIEQLIVEVKEKQKLQAELEIARQVQTQLFPKEVPSLKTLELAGECRPARVVSGDYYDFVPFDSGSTALIIGDISGKGISAALLMASIQSSLHAQLKMQTNGGISTSTLVARLNRQLYESTPPEKYATFYCGFYDDRAGRLSYTNAGHLAPILIRGTEITRLESNGTVIGLFPDVPYGQSVVDLLPGDILMAFTDGITESENRSGQQFGEDRLAELLISSRNRSLKEILDRVKVSVRDWAGDLDDQDDTTILLARRI